MSKYVQICPNMSKYVRFSGSGGWGYIIKFEQYECILPECFAILHNKMSGHPDH